MNNTIPLPQVLHNAGDTPTLTFTILDDSGAVIIAANITTITCTLTDVGSATDIRDQQDVNGINNGSMATTSGIFKLRFQPADTVLQNAANKLETREIAIRFAHTDGVNNFIDTFFAKFKVQKTNY